MASVDFNYARTRPRTIISRCCPSARLSNFPAGGRWDFSLICPTGVNGNLWGIDFNWNFDHFSPLNGGTYVHSSGVTSPVRRCTRFQFSFKLCSLDVRDLKLLSHISQQSSNMLVNMQFDDIPPPSSWSSHPKNACTRVSLKEKKKLNNNRPTTVPTLLTCSLHDMWALVSWQLSHPHTPFTSATHTHFGPNETRVWHIPQIGWSLCGD